MNTSYQRRRLISRGVVVIIAALLLVIGRVTPGLAAEVMFSAGIFNQWFPGDGSIAWTGSLSPGGYFIADFEPLTVEGDLQFVPSYNSPALGFTGLGWESRVFRGGSGLFGVKFSRRIAATFSFHMVVSRESLKRGGGFVGSNAFEQRLATAFRQSSLALMLRLYPVGDLFFSVGLRRTSASFEISMIETVNGQPSLIVVYPRIDAQTTIDPAVGVGYDLMIAGGLGLTAHLSHTFSEFRNFKQEAPLDVFPNVKLDNGGTSLYVGATLRLSRKRW